MRSSARGNGSLPGAVAVLIAGVALAIAVVSAAVVVITKLMIAIAAPADDAVLRRDAGVAQQFIAANAVFSCLTACVMLIIFMMQRTELRRQREQLKLQADEHRAELRRATDEAFRSSETGLRSLHAQLVKFAIDDPSLAVAWTGYEDVDPQEARRFLYANLIFQHHLLAQKLGTLSPKEMTNHLRVLVANPVFQEFWEHSRPIRDHLDPHGTERALGNRIDALICELRRNVRQQFA